jgi:nucleotide-binding universal stress UspA family protein
MHPERAAAGDVVDGFTLVEKLHVGGMAAVWSVERAEDTTPLVMKMPLLRWGENPATIVGFEVETMILPRVSGPHVPRFVAAGDFNSPYIVMERIDGHSLKGRLDQLPRPVAEIADIGAKVATALHAIHLQHVVHLDVKPSNIMFRPSGEAVMVDFGFARHDHLPDLLDEEFHAPLGTGPYISPEQVRLDRSDPRSDLFALGVMLYFFTTGERPFGEPTTIREWRHRLWRDPVPPRHLRPDCPPWLQEVILRCLEVDPDRRYASASQLAFHLRHPEEIPLTARAERSERDGVVTVFRRWLKERRPQPLGVERTKRSVSAVLARAPIIVAAVDLSPEHEGLADALRVAVRRVMVTEPSARLACVNILKTALLKLDEFETEAGGNLQLNRLAALKHWAHPLDLPPERVTYHVLEAVDVGAAILDYVRNNHADHLLMGARAASGMRRYLGSVSAGVVAEAPCTVTVVRAGAAA